MNKNNEIISAHKRDEFFICAYHVKNPNNLKQYLMITKTQYTILIVMKAISDRLLLQLRQIYLKQNHKFTIKLLIIIICIQNPK